MKPVIFSLLILFSIYPSVDVFAQVQWETHPLQLNAELSERVKFGYLAVPESRDVPHSREIHMGFTIVSSYSDDPLPDPVVIIPGGPGFGASAFIVPITGNKTFQNILQNRDLVLVDPRGSGFSYPSICDNLNTEEFRFRSIFSSDDEKIALLEEEITACAEAIADSDLDVLAYNSVEVAHDLETLRRTLGYEKWNIRGHSYGTRFGMTLLQQYPYSVRSAVFSGLVPLFNHNDMTEENLSRSLRLLFEKCEDDTDCNEAFPSLKSDFTHLLKRLKIDPIPVPDYVTTGFSGDAYFITTNVLLDGLFSLLYEKNGIEVVPLIIHHLARGNDWIAQSMSVPLANQFSAMKNDVNLIISNNDAEHDPDFRSSLVPDELTELLRYYFQGQHANSLNSYWPVIRGTKQLPKEVWNQTNIPVLLISGELDPVTPPGYADSLSEYFANGVHHVISGSGHSPHYDADIDFAPFIDNPDIHFEINSHMEVKPLQFVTNVSLNKAISEYAARLMAGSYRPFIVSAAALILCLIGFLFFPFRYIFRKIRRKPSDGFSKEIFSIWMVTFLTLVIASLFYLSIMDTAASNPYALAVGLSAKWDFINIVAIALIILLVVNMWTVRKIWNNTSGVKIPTVISMTGAGMFAIFIWISGLV